MVTVPPFGTCRVTGTLFGVLTGTVPYYEFLMVAVAVFMIFWLWYLFLMIL